MKKRSQNQLTASSRTCYTYKLLRKIKKFFKELFYKFARGSDKLVWEWETPMGPL